MSAALSGLHEFTERKYPYGFVTELEGPRCPMALSTGVRINAADTDQFQRTISNELSHADH